MFLSPKSPMRRRSWPALAAAGESAALQSTGDYEFLSNPRVEVTNFNPEPFTGLAFDSQNRLWAVNPYGNTIVRYDSIATSNPGTVFPTGLNPVSIATWTPPPTPPFKITPGGNMRVLVACNGTHGLFMHNSTNGRILDFIRLDSEPADMVVDKDNNRAFVSCQGDNTVVEVDLLSFQIVRRYVVTCGSRPGPLYLDRGVPGDASDNRVYVAPSLTGNNSVPIPPNPGAVDPGTGLPLEWRAAGIVKDLDLNSRDDDADNRPDNQLPDEDLFRINPQNGTIEPVVLHAGSLIFDVDRNPFSGQVWILSTHSRNKEVGFDTEPLIRGNFAVNQLVQVTGVTNTSPLISVGLGADLDLVEVDPGPPAVFGYDRLRSINQARTVEFQTASGVEGFAFVASAQSDVIAHLTPSGLRVGELSLPPGAQCYDLALLPSNPSILAALCLRTMTVEVFDLTQPSPVPVPHSLGFDPTPPQIKSGRDIFLDGQRSKDGRFTCGSCHPRGMSDILCWPLRGHPTDEKDIMLTQSLLSIADTFPHHWRGERDLFDFQKAFGGLLGAPDDEVPDTAEMGDFVVFVQSLQAPANPLEDHRRILNDANGTIDLPSPPVPSAGMSSSAVHGQDVFLDPVSFNEKTCAECHAPQSGSDGSLMSEGFIKLRASRSMPIEMAHLRQLLLRTPKFVTIDPFDGTDKSDFNQNGFGSLHDGREASLLHFLVQNFPLLVMQDRVDAFRFTEQFDQGISPAVHWGQRFWSGSPSNVEADIQAILIDGATKPPSGPTTKPWNDVVAVGRFDPDGAGGPSGLVPVRWWYDASIPTPAFVADRATTPLTSWTWSTMMAETRAGRAEHVFYGVPHRNGRRIGIDHDGDGVVNGFETLTDPWNPDSDGDEWPDGYDDDPLAFDPDHSGDVVPPTIKEVELDFANSRLAKYHVLFSEDVKYTVTYQSVRGSVLGPLRTFTRDYFSTADTFVLTHEESSTQADPPFVPNDITNQFNVSITYRDRKTDRLGGLPVTEPLTPFVADVVHFPDFPSPPIQANLHVKNLDWASPPTVGESTLSGTIRMKLDYNFGAPDFVALDDFQLPPGNFPWRADDKMVFLSVAVKHAGENQQFVKLNETTSGLGFTTDHPTRFDIVRQGNPGVLIDYVVDPGPDWICSPHTGSLSHLGNEETEISLEIHGLVDGDVIKISVMGVVTPVTAGSASGGYKEQSLRELQPFLLEDTMEFVVTF